MLRTHKIVSLLRSKLTVLTMLILGGAIAPQAIAQCGANTIPIPANTWAMLGVPCVPSAPDNTVATFFGPSLNTQNLPNNGYGTGGGSWIAYKKGYSAAECPTASDPENCYVVLTGSETIQRGDAFWVYSLNAATLDLSSINASNTPGPYVQSPAYRAVSNATPRYTMFANPYEASVEWADVRFTGNIGNFPINLSSSQASTGSFWTVASPNVHYWDGNTYFTRSLASNPAATFEPKEGAWIEMLRGSGFGLLIDNLMIRVLDPTP